MEVNDRLPQSPLTLLKNSTDVPADKVAAIEARLRDSYVPSMTEYQREARLRAEKVRDKILY